MTAAGDIIRDMREAMAELDALPTPHAAFIEGSRAVMAREGQPPETGAKLYIGALPAGVRVEHLPTWIVVSPLLPADRVYICRLPDWATDGAGVEP